MKHKHHIIPKHMGGTDDNSNLVELSVEEHAEAHRLLYEQHGRREDYLAWKGLAGLISKEELVKELLLFAAKKGNASRTTTNKGMKYKCRKDRKHVGNSGTKWYHNPENPIEKCCLKESQEIPKGWIRGQGKKSKNPGLNFHAKKKYL